VELRWRQSLFAIECKSRDRGENCAENGGEVEGDEQISIKRGKAREKFPDQSRGNVTVCNI
jgi:hypothetical protein